MQIGVVYPQTELPTDAATVKAYVEATEELGYRHVLIYDHVVGADPKVYTGWSGPYDIDTTFHEPLVLYGYLAAITKMELVTGIIISPQRQTALLAKQAAEVDILTGGHFRLGLGIGWNTVEYDALGQDFNTRGRRQEEQIGLLRRFWTERSVTFEGRFDRVRGAGLLPLPIQRPIPVWLGGTSAAAYDRIGRVADGWFPQVGRARHWTAQLPPSPRPQQGRGETPRRWGWKGAPASTENRPKPSRTPPRSGAALAPPISPSIPWAQVYPGWALTCRRWPSVPSCFNFLRRRQTNPPPDNHPPLARVP